MFIEIKKQNGISSNSAAFTDDEQFFLNLSSIKSISFNSDTKNNTISINYVDDFTSNFFFTKEAIGEYQRIKRIIENQILK